MPTRGSHRYGRSAPTRQRPNDSAASDAPALEFKPLYQQVKDALLTRLVEGVWRPGMSLPSELQLAGEMNVSQGTVRKALDALAAENLLVRVQGRGTFVAEFEDSRILFRFFRLTRDDGIRQLPQATATALQSRRASSTVRERLGLAQGERVWVLERQRKIGERPLILETIVLPFRLFPGLDSLQPIPNNVYALYASRFGLTISRVTERTKAVLASERDVAALECETGAPLLQVDRVAYCLRDFPIEWRLSHYYTNGFHYLAEF